MQPLLLRARRCGFLENTTAAAAAAAVVVVVAYCGCCYWSLFSHSNPLKQTTLTHQYACSHALSCLSASKMAEIHTLARTHAKYGLSNGGSSHADSPRRVYPFHSGSIPRSYSTSLCSSFNLSLSLCTSISAGVWAQLWIRSLGVNPWWCSIRPENSGPFHQKTHSSCEN